MDRIYFAVDRCVMCGEIVNEGRQVCVNCEDKVNRKHQAFLEEKAVREAAETTKRRLGPFRRK